MSPEGIGGDFQHLGEHEKRQLEMLRKTSPKAFAQARIMEIRRRLSKEMGEVATNPSKYNNQDVMDWFRDHAKEKKLQFWAKRDKGRPNLIHLFMRDPIIESMDSRPVPRNACWLGTVEKDTLPDKTLGE